MELDEIKKVWSETDPLEKLQVDDGRTKEMLKNEGTSALERLVRGAKFRMIAGIPLGLLMCVVLFVCVEDMILPLILLSISIFLEPSRIYQYRLLKGIDYSGMSVKEVSARILKYQQSIQKRRMYATIVFFVFMGSWIAWHYVQHFGCVIHWGLIIYAVGLYLAAGLLLMPFLYKKLHYNHINRIKENLKELEAFEAL